MGPQAVFAGLALWGATGVQWGIKQLFERSRPELWPRLVPEHGYAFPSGHTTVAAALSLVLMVLAWHTRGTWARRAAVGALVLVPLSVALARLYRGMHHPSDVVAAFVNGGSCVLIAARTLLFGVLPASLARRLDGHPTPGVRA